MKNVCSACTEAHTNWSHDFLHQVISKAKNLIFNYLPKTAKKAEFTYSLMRDLQYV